MMKNYNEVIAMPRIKENFIPPTAGVPEGIIPYDSSLCHEFSPPCVSTTGNDFLNAHIGKKMCLEFFLGNSLIKKEGVLVSIAPNYIILHSCNPCEKLICNTDSIKFVTIIEEKES